MSDRIETQTGTSQNAQAHSGYATQPTAFRPGASIVPGAGYGSVQAAGFNWKPYLLGTLITGMALFLFYQQTQIARLSNELNLVSDNVKSSDVRNRLDAQATSLQEINRRITYLDSKINATDQKAQIALNKLKENEENDIFGNAIKSIRHTFGF